ncbi:MAG: TIGR00730 family Rossman fold protein, partial [Bacteroidota bacterium]
MQEKERVCVYCASSAKIAPKYFEVATTLAQELVKADKKVVFGGGASGLMGRLADETLRLGGDIIGIMPHFMRQIEWAHKEVKEFEFVEDMRERKKRLLEGSSAVVTLAGGSGTLEELIEAITLKRLGLYLNPIVIVNTDGYYDPFKEMLERCVSENFMHESHLKMWTFV